MSHPSSIKAWRRAGGLAGVLVVLSSAPARALDKQGSAHGGSVQGEESGLAVGGSLALGVALHNPGYAARPDNTGLALFRYVAHADLDLIGRRLSIPVDINMFTDRQQHGAAKLRPSELDVIAGLTSTWRLGPGALEVGARVEHDAPLDGLGATHASQTYGDLRARYLFSLADSLPAVGRFLADGDISGYATFGWFALNKSYFARPDNTGIALLRYVGHAEISTWHSHLAVGFDATMFTPRGTSDPLAPTELDFTLELIGRLPPFELHIASERDMPIAEDGPILPGHVQAILYMLASWSFDLGLGKGPSATARGDGG